MKVFVSWSGGKDSSLALHRALEMGLEVGCLFSMLDEDGLRSRSHCMERSILESQALALGIPLICGRATWETYEEEFKRVARKLRVEGYGGGVFGDINLSEHRHWVERVCGEVGIKAFEPLWGEKYENLLAEFFSNKFEAIIINVKADLISGEWLGKSFNSDFIAYLKRRGIDLCGERGEYHTLTVYGPPFKQRLKIAEAERILQNGRWILKISKVELE
ncbi:diphthine--ammonia ligase [Candidatus Bathyarchaeota archaeon]|nr:MAG: diphthine--ammonia ligase [Candidatus Bathyarchaeota archaeon]